ncbi:hypothetical protein D3C72_1355140 [compost metagenome]
MNSKSDSADRIFSASCSSSVMEMAGWVADFSPRLERISEGFSRTSSLTRSAMMDLPYIFFRWPIGTLPGRKPLMRTLSLASTRRSSRRAFMSAAGITILSSRFSPSASVSITCIFSNLHIMAAVLRQPLVYFRALRRKLRSPAVASLISLHKRLPHTFAPAPETKDQRGEKNPEAPRIL